MIAYKAAQLWSTLPTMYNNLRSLDLFKSKKAGIIVISRATFVQFSCRFYKLKLRAIAGGVLINRQIS